MNIIVNEGLYEMKKTWKRLLAVSYVVSLLIVMPGMSVLADEMYDEAVVTATNDVNEIVEVAEIPTTMQLSPDYPREAVEAEDVKSVYKEDWIDESADAEGTVGARVYTVGDGVTATFDKTSGAVEFYSNSGTLWKTWQEDSGLDTASISSIKVVSGTVYLPEDSSFIFAVSYYNSDYDEYDYTLEELDLSGFDTSKVRDMSAMFWCCESLKKLDLSGFDTSNVITMARMFYGCESLTDLNLNSFNTSKVTDMEEMFVGCSSLTNIGLSDFDTSHVTSMYSMFLGCSSITQLDLNAFDTFNVTDMGYMFGYCRSLTKLDLSGFDTTNVKDMSMMLFSCTGIINLDLSSFNTSKVTNMESMFYGCNSLKELDLSSLILNKKTKVGNCFSNCSNLQLIKTPKSNSVSVELPTTMYDENGKIYTKIPALTKSITLSKVKPATVSGLGLNSFSDVQDPKHAYYKAIYWAADAGITKGYPDGTFGIDRSCTRGEMIMFLWRYSAKPSPKAVAKSPFSDVPKTHAFYNAILWASQKGITKGYPNGTFGINRNVSRGECMMFLWRLKGKLTPKTVSASPFKDVPKSHAFYKAILWGYQKGITTGYTSGAKKGTFGINENCTRGAIVTFLYRAK